MRRVTIPTSLVARAQQATARLTTAVSSSARSSAELVRSLHQRAVSARPPREPLWRRAAAFEAEIARWRSRPLAAATLKALVVLIPAAAAITVTALLNWGVRPPGEWPVRLA